VAIRALFGSSSVAPPRKRAASPILLVALLLIALATLQTLAYASPPDPSWIPGIYDDADFDDVVVLITSGTGDVGPALPADSHSTLLLVERPAQPTERASLAVSVSAVRPRAPPPS
jgi:hypothetical protein